MRTFAICSNKINENKPVRHRAKWTNELLRDAIINLKNNTAEVTAVKLGVSILSLKRALHRRGLNAHAIKRLNVRAYQASINRKGGNKKPDSFFVSQSSLSEDSPFLAQNAFENKPHNGCSWPIGDLNSEEFSFCGAKRAKGSYCAAHHERAYLPAPPLSELGLGAYL